MAAHLDPAAWEKKKKIIIIVSVSVTVALILLLTGWLLLRDKIRPARDYARAEKLLEKGSIAEAIEIFESLWDYRDANDRAAALAFGQQEDKTIEQTLKSAKPGDYITFGRYEQDNVTENGPEPIVWFVLAEKDGRLLLWSKDALDHAQYNSGQRDVTWKECSLRTFLNDDFYNTAFTDSEKLLIPNAKTRNGGNSASITKGGDDTMDHVVIMSFDELLEYGVQNLHLEWIGTYPTEYAKAQGVESHAEYGTCKWWIRTPGMEQSHAVYCDMIGQPLYSAPVSRKGIGVRPMIWVLVGDRGE